MLNTSIFAIYDHIKTVVKTTIPSKYNPNISDMHFEGKLSNLMIVNFIHYTICN